MITVGMLAKIRRMHLRDRISIREIAKRCNLSRNTVRDWLREPEIQEPKYATRRSPSLIDPYLEQLQQWIETDSHRAKRDRRTGRAMYEAIKAQGYTGSCGRAVLHIGRLKKALEQSPQKKAFVPMRFAHGEAFQFDWSCEYAWIGGLRRRLEVSHCKLASSRAFWIVAYYKQSHEMLFDAHTQSFQAFGGIPRRGIYDNMKSAVDKVSRGKERTVNARFEAMCGHYLFEPDFCNVASGWEKGIVEKNVQDRRRQIWAEVGDTRWTSLAELNAWLAKRCKADWENMRHPEWVTMTIAEVLQDERQELMRLPKPFDGYVEQPVRVSSTSLIQYQRNRYSVPTPYAHRIVSLHIYPEVLTVIADGIEICRHVRSFERHQTIYDWQHYVPVIVQKPGALRNGAPFMEMPEALRTIQRHLLKHDGGDRIMAQVLASVPMHGLDAVLVAVELALETGRPSGEHVLNVLGRLKESLPPNSAQAVSVPFTLTEEPAANVSRYEHLRVTPAQEISHV